MITWEESKMTVIYHPRYLDHILTYGHPESPERLKAIMAKLQEEKLDGNIIEPQTAKDQEIELAHASSYVEFIKNCDEGWIDPNTYARDQSYEIAALAVGGAILGAKLAYEKSKPTFNLPRPPGHHATYDASGGFCFFNNIAVAANYLRKNMDDIEKVAIIDIDVHHGNGTHDIFFKDPDVLYISTHQWGIYPGTGPAELVGDKKGEGFTVNIPFHSGAGDSSFELAFDNIVEPIIKQFKPSMILASLGTDAHYTDPLAMLNLSSQGYLNLTNRIQKLADKLCDSKLSYFLEGGYEVNVLAEIVTSVVAGFENKKIDLAYTEEYDTKIKGESVVEKVIDIQGKYWDL
jgi:acetoin utilization deacetylase AcuC-like enzyme